MLDTARIDAINAKMQENRMDQSVIKCYVEELLESKTLEGIRIILREIKEGNQNSIVVKKAVLKAGDKGTKLLCRYYPQLNPAEQKKALDLLGEIQSESSVGFLKKVFSGADQSLAKAAIPGLIPYVNEEMIPMIFDVIETSDSDAELGAACVLLLVSLKSAAVQKLIKIVKEKHGICAEKAIFALGEIGDKKVTGIFCDCLKSSEKYDIGIVAEALGKIKDPESAQPLCEALKKNSPGKDEIVVALGEIGNPIAAETLVDYYYQFENGLISNNKKNKLEKNALIDHQALIIEAMGKMKDRAVIKPITDSFKKSSGKCRLAALDALVRLRGLLGDISFFSALYNLPSSIHQNAVVSWFHLDKGEIKDECRGLITGEAFTLEKYFLNIENQENNALVACLLLPFSFEKENALTITMQAEAITSMRLLNPEFLDAISASLMQADIADEVMEILKWLKGLNVEKTTK